MASTQPPTPPGSLAPGWRRLLRPVNTPGSPPGEIMVVPTGRVLGAEILGVDLSQSISDALGRELRRAWLEHLVLLFRAQTLTPQAQVDAANVFGTPEVPAAVKYYELSNLPPPNLVHRNIMTISNLGPDGMPVEVNDGLGSGEVQWHSDNSYTERPPSGSMLHSLEVPPQGGDTGFSNQYAAYETLPSEIRAQIQTLGAVHDSSRNSAGVLRPGVQAPRSLDEVPGPTHPLVRVHPDTGRPALYLGRRRAFPSQYIPGVTHKESEALLDLLWNHATEPHLTWFHQWQPGDVILWDNRCTMHRREPHDARFPRIMHRVQLEGTPVVAFNSAPG